MYIIWLFTVKDSKSIVLPETAFGILSAMSGRMLTTNATLSLFGILSRSPPVVLWNWLKLLLFDVANQRLPKSITEDAVNKSWRPLPSKCLTAMKTQYL